MFGSGASAQEDAAEAVSWDVDISGAELGVSDPTILPTSPLYFLKNVSRFFQGALTFNPVKRAELSLKFANEKLLEAKKLAERQGIPGETLRSALENYNREMERIRQRLETAAEKTPALENFLDKLVDYGIKQQKILDKISGDFRPARETVEQIKEKSLETVNAVPLRLEAAEEFGRRLERVVNQQAGSGFKDFKNLEVLKEVELKVPEQAKDAVRRAQENTLSRLQQTLTNLNEAERIKFENYAKEIPGSLPRQIQILNNLKQTAVSGSLKELTEKIQEQTLERLQTRIQEEATATTTVAINEEKARQTMTEANTALDKLQKIIETNAAAADRFPAVFRLKSNAEKHLDDARRAIAERRFGAAWSLANAALQNVQNALRIFEIRPEAILEPAKPATTTVTHPRQTPTELYCIHLWQPVCGADGKTYSNDCFARVAGVRVSYEGECKKKEQNQEKAEEMARKAWKAIQELETMIGKLTPETDIIGGPETSANNLSVADRITQARNLLVTAINHYQLAKESVAAGRFADAYTHAEMALRAAEKGLAILGTGPTPSPAPAARPRPVPTIIIPSPSPGNIMCGGIAGKPCPAGYACRYLGSYPDASGTCVPASPTKPTPTIECPPHVPPACKVNEKPVSPGIGANGCPLPPKCASIAPLQPIQ